MTRSALSNIAYEALVRARRKFSNREERCIRETWTAEQELVLLRLYPDMPNEVLAARLNKTLQQICSKAYRLGLKKPRVLQEDPAGLGQRNSVQEGKHPVELRHEGASRARTLIGNAVQEGAEAPHMAPGRQHTGKCRWLPATKDLGYRLSPGTGRAFTSCSGKNTSAPSQPAIASASRTTTSRTSSSTTWNSSPGPNACAATPSIAIHLS